MCAYHEREAAAAVTLTHHSARCPLCHSVLGITQQQYKGGRGRMCEKFSVIRQDSHWIADSNNCYYLNTSRLSHGRLCSQAIVLSPPPHLKSPFPQLAGHLSSNLSVVQEHKAPKQQSQGLGGDELCLGMLNVTAALLWKASSLF